MPRHTSLLTTTGTAEQPVDRRWPTPPPSPDIVGFARSGDTVTASSPGPFTGTTAPKGTAKVSLAATTQPFDPAAQASTGQFWDLDADFQSLSVAVGKTGTMTLALAPAARAGTVVHGILYVDTESATDVANGSGITGIPYTCTVG
ncbi:hypothetical protein RKE30_15430 [Streptomyces sp. Li-HN-5-11]|uniref:hypothetical protein n=1 Tax=Streptomyces sp. Li-HN-5-11 TaxID=3075432 RepID=UPI0028AB9F6A|nr:hypothetical protein [Streptomyces sp. Li-HN-5-11]WNM36818.1 hypothetical protein RKE30_15430 [Streptomyces sp. Li-HN-5-11]